MSYFVILCFLPITGFKNSFFLKCVFTSHLFLQVAILISCCDNIPTKNLLPQNIMPAGLTRFLGAPVERFNGL